MVDKKLDILFAVNIPFPEGGANTRRISNIAREMAKNGHHVTILIPFARKLQKKKGSLEGVDVEWCLVPRNAEVFKNKMGRIKLYIQIISRVKWLLKLYKKSMRKEYDWLYLYQPGFDGLMATTIAVFFNRKIVSEYVDLLSSSGSDGIIWKFIYRLQLYADQKVPLKSNLLITISSKLKNVYEKRNPDVPVLIVPTLVDCKRFGVGDSSYFRKKLDIRAKFIITFAGSFVKTEGLALLIEAFSMLVRNKKNIFLLIAGGSLVPGADDPLKLISEFDIENDAEFLGFLPEEKVVDLLAASDVLVMSKLNDPINHAGFGTKLSEYLSAGRPVIASDVGDISRYLVNDRDVILVDPGNLDELVIALQRLVNDRKTCRLLGGHARKAALHKFDVPPHVLNILNSMSSN
ncbi:glycosyltransferase family 4 protein [Desulfobacula sp.]|uniref:glycosyltransferase family 4 protein n=1 Tax=Desulfobacula sp. TaxID=2593537 RepID=UPI002714B270|nr:glycosyltransferase family 4 protein [Desulfobacula sp.]